MPPDSRVSIAAFACTLSDLVALDKNTGQSESIFQLTNPVILSVTVTFSGSGAIALVPLSPQIQVDFFAKSLRDRQELELGCVTLTTLPKQLIYTPAISLANGFDTVGAESNQAYGVSALVRIGASSFPSLITGMIEGLLLQTYD
ncbi:MAG: hypothetical protein NW224_27030 [Leptolyngbyaceae cyanobacterium bins.302]|nr:hypothetical protein [Leptolyngbyaceae cyanobacterium bins.302]